MKLTLTIQTSGCHNITMLTQEPEDGGQPKLISKSEGFAAYPEATGAVAIRQGVEFLRDYQRQALSTDNAGSVLAVLKNLHDTLAAEMRFSPGKNERLSDAMDDATAIIKSIGRLEA